MCVKGGILSQGACSNLSLVDLSAFVQLAAAKARGCWGERMGGIVEGRGGEEREWWRGGEGEEGGD